MNNGPFWNRSNANANNIPQPNGCMAGFGKLALVAFLLAVVITISFVVYWMSTVNREVQLRESIKAQQTECRAHFGKMWEVMRQKAGIAAKYSEDFKSIYPDLIRGRYSDGGGGLMKWIQEHNPEFDSSLYKDLMATVEGERNSFHTSQKRLIDLKREHDVLRKSFPATLILSGTEEIEIQVITTEYAEETYQRGVETERDLFEDKP